MLGTGGRLGCILVWVLLLISWLKQGAWEPHMPSPFLPFRDFLATGEMQGLVE